MCVWELYMQCQVGLYLECKTEAPASCFSAAQASLLLFLSLSSLWVINYLLPQLLIFI